MALPVKRSLKAVGPLLTLLILVFSGCSDDDPGTPAPVEDRSRSGGETTIDNATTLAFTFPAPNVADLDKHLDGDLAFEVSFVSAPAPVNPGLGPIFNNNACVACHISNGRGAPPEGNEGPETMLVRISIPGTDAVGGPNPAPGFGGQLNDKSIFGTQPEAEVHFTWIEETHQFNDGEAYSLRRPVVELVNPYTELPEGYMISPRVAPPVFGRGLLEAIPPGAILAHEDVFDADADGVSGKANWVHEFLTGETKLGRFGLKANQPSLIQQAASAYRNDMGVTNPIFPEDSAHGQPQGDGLSDDPEIDFETVDLAAFYTQTLAVPARRNIDDPEVMRGEKLFADANCTACHTPRFETGVLDGIPSVSNQIIYPFSDMLLHDMGAEMADGRPDYLADGNEWRTPPLWGIGLTELVHDHSFFLHDGRARNLMEAIMWHFGEGENSRNAVSAMSAEERAALIAFLESL